MKKVEMYEANDGSIHYTEKEAKNRDKLLELEEWYEENKLFGRFDGCKIEWEDLIEWISENKEIVQELLFIA